MCCNYQIDLLEKEWVGGITNVKVEYYDISRNASGEGGLP